MIETHWESLEADAIMMFLERRNARTVAIDTFPIPPARFFSEYRRLMDRVESNSSNYRYCVDLNRERIQQFGSVYLNSDESLAIVDWIPEEVDYWVGNFHSNQFESINKEWNEWNRARECGMAESITSFATKNHFQRAVVLLGFAHKKRVLATLTKRMKEIPESSNWHIEAWTGKINGPT